jgi:hypothetical protein
MSELSNYFDFRCINRNLHIANPELSANRRSIIAVIK